MVPAEAVGYAGCIRHVIEPFTHDAVTAATDAIWQLFEAGLIDDDSATLALLAIAIGIRHAGRNHAMGQDGTHDLQTG